MQIKIIIIGVYTSSEDEANTKNQFFAKFNGMIANIGRTRKLFLSCLSRTGREVNKKTAGS